jgi:RNA-binding protein
MPIMSPKRIPARRSRPTATRATPDQAGQGRRGPKPNRRKRVRAGSDRTPKSARGHTAVIEPGTDPQARGRATTRGSSDAATARPTPGSYLTEGPAPAPDLSERQRRHLRGLAHELKPIIRLGNAGLTDAVTAETARALHDHELIKVKAAGGDREARDALFSELARRTSSALVHRIGNVAVLYRPNATLPRILIPDAGA